MAEGHGELHRHQVSPGTLVLDDLRSAPASAELGLRQGVFVVASVVSRGEGRVTLDAGSKALAPDVSPPNAWLPDYTELIPLRPSEEHLPLRIPDGGRAPNLGERVVLVPAHACTTVNLHAEVLLVQQGTAPRLAPLAAVGHPLRTDPPT